MSDCPICATAAVRGKDAFNRVVEATTLKGGVNRLPNGDIDWDSFCKAVEGSLNYALSPNPKRKK